jgi:hypothetical protein
MRTPFLVSAAALALGLAVVATHSFAAQQSPDGGPIKRWPTALDGGAGVPTGRVSGGDRIAIGHGQLEQRRSPGGGSPNGGGVRGGGGPQGGGRVAVPRGSGGGGRPVVGGGGRVIVQPRGYYYNRFPAYYYPYSSYYWGPGYFDTFGYWGAGWGPSWGYAGSPYGFGGYRGYGYGSGFGYGGYGYDTGRVRLEVRPRDAEVFIDGYYAGQVDDFDGRLQGLTLETGGYSGEIRKPGWETLTFDVRVTPGRTTHYKGELLPRKE